MKKLIIPDKWEYEILKNEGEGLKGYGYQLKIFKNDIMIFKTGSFGAVSIAEASARDYFLSAEFDIYRE